MNDPHVVSLTYTACPSESTSFEKAPSLEGTYGSMHFRLDGETLRVEPIDHFGSVEEARRYIDPLLRAWEIDIVLRFDTPELSFIYQKSEVIDRHPLAPGERNAVLNVQLGEVILKALAVTMTAHVSRGSFPQPPSRFRVTPDVETLWKRYQGYREGREPLPSMAYFCLTLLEDRAGNRGKASDKFMIAKEVLAKIGQLASERGDASTARKHRAITSGRPLTDAENAWLKEAIKLIIRRVGEIGSDNAIDEIKMDDLPQLF